MKSIGIDLGGTNIKLVILSEQGELLHSEQTPTFDTGPDDWRQHVIDTVQHLRAGYGEETFLMGLSAPGLANQENSAIALMPGRLKGLEGFVWSEALGQDCPVLNDAHAALLAERYYGAGRGCRHLLMLTLGTGIGGALLLNGELYQGFDGRAGHLGHISISKSSHLDITNTPGSLEYALGNAYLPDRSFGLYRQAEDLIVDYKAGKAIASYIWLQMMRDLASGISSLINAFSPEKIILGGGLTHAGMDLFGPLQEFMQVFEWRPSGVQVPIVKAQFDVYSGAIGAAAFAINRRNKNSNQTNNT
ncbi:MAG: ROK family protein [Cyclobacteriaceae bacterium]|nr:ROK family protein [Cyclobacteriaceae bacterium]